MKNTLTLIILFTCFHAFSQGVPDYVPKCGLIAWYPFTGNAVDSTSYRHDGTVHGATLVSDRYGNLNRAYRFNGTSDYIMINTATASLDSTMNINGSISIAAWIKSSDYSRGQEQIFWRGDASASYDPYSVYVDASTLGFRRDVGTSSITKTITYSITGVDTLFHHVVATFDSVIGDMKIYFDGALVSSASRPGTATYPTSGFWNVIGAVDLGNWQYFFGCIDDLALWNRCLTPCEVSSLYLSKKICDCDSVGTTPPPPPDSLYITAIDTDCLKLCFQAFSNDTNVILYDWDFGDGVTATGNPICHTYTKGGTYTVTVTTTNKTGKKSTATYGATVVHSSIQASGDTTICIGASAQLHVQGGTNYSWSPAASLNNASIPDPVATPAASTNYIVTATDDKGCIAGDTVAVVVVPLPEVTARINEKYQNCANPGIQLIASGAISYEWQPANYCDNHSSSMPIVTLADEPVTFYVTGTDSHGCVDTASVKVYPHKTAIVSLPDAFSPNGDGANEVLYVRGANVASLNFSVYNRWGQRIFETNDINKGWDGTYGGSPQPMEAYLYIIKITTQDGCEVIKKGSVTLLR